MPYQPISYRHGPLCLECWLEGNGEVILYMCDLQRNQGFDSRTGEYRIRPQPLHSPIDGGESIKYL